MGNQPTKCIPPITCDPDSFCRLRRPRPQDKANARKTPRIDTPHPSSYGTRGSNTPHATSSSHLHGSRSTSRSKGTPLARMLTPPSRASRRSPNQAKALPAWTQWLHTVIGFLEPVDCCTCRLVCRAWARCGAMVELKWKFDSEAIPEVSIRSDPSCRALVVMDKEDLMAACNIAMVVAVGFTAASHVVNQLGATGTEGGLIGAWKTGESMIQAQVAAAKQYQMHMNYANRELGSMAKELRMAKNEIQLLQAKLKGQEDVGCYSPFSCYDRDVQYAVKKSDDREVMRQNKRLVDRLAKERSERLMLQQKVNHLEKILEHQGDSGQTAGALTDRCGSSNALSDEIMTERLQSRPSPDLLPAPKPKPKPRNLVLKQCCDPLPNEESFQGVHKSRLDGGSSTKAVTTLQLPHRMQDPESARRRMYAPTVPVLNFSKLSSFLG
mmetsp:Transcript_22274/g.39954  ORF Transcript_22274/g.39954 Transcript_22274/m.39954 type:complete len:439 (-) Transcript_22274:547-1863(-)